MWLNSAKSEEQLQKFREFYKESVGLDIATEQVVIPERRRPGFNRLILVAKDLTLTRVIEICEKHFPSGTYYKSVEEIAVSNDRAPTNNYAIWTKDRVEPDVEYSSVSATETKRLGIKCMTILERLILGAKFFVETGRQLDEENFTLCAGSRDINKETPGTFYDPNLCLVLIKNCPSDKELPGVRIREVIV